MPPPPPVPPVPPTPPTSPGGDPAVSKRDEQVRHRVVDDSRAPRASAGDALHMVAGAAAFAGRLVRILRFIFHRVRGAGTGAQRAFHQHLGGVLRFPRPREFCGCHFCGTARRNPAFQFCGGPLRATLDFHFVIAVVHGRNRGNGFPAYGAGNCAVARDRRSWHRRGTRDDRHLHHRADAAALARPRDRGQSDCGFYRVARGGAAFLVVGAARTAGTGRLALGGAGRIAGRDFCVVHSPRLAGKSALVDGAWKICRGRTRGGDDGKARAAGSREGSWQAELLRHARNAQC